MEILKNLTGNELKIMMVILLKCEGGHQYRTMDSLQAYGLSYPTISKSIDGLKKKGVIRKFSAGQGAEIILELKTPYDQLSDHLKAFKVQLRLELEDEKDQDGGKFTPKTGHVAGLIYHYAIAQGESPLKIKDWNKRNFKKNIRAATYILEYCGDDIEVAKKAIERGKDQAEHDRLSWSLGGYICTNLHKFVDQDKVSSNAGRWY